LRKPGLHPYNTGLMDPLAKLFGSAARVKLLRLFIFNEEEWFTPSEAAFRAKAGKAAARKEILSLFAVKVLRKKAGRGSTLYSANPRFAHYEALKTFLRTASGVDDGRITKTLKKAGAIRLVALSGLFTDAPESKVDLLIVGDKLDERVLSAIVHNLEAELGRELRYACFTTEDFRYRIGVYDRLVRDVLDYPHRLVIDRIGM
jgi:predicted nucleotidyltransferase